MAAVAVRDDFLLWAESLTFAARLKHPHDDPVFEGITRDFLSMDTALSQIEIAVTAFTKTVHEFCTGLVGLSDAVVLNLTKNTERIIASDCCKFREAINSIARVDAPHSTVSKLMRDLDFNITTPLKQHLSHNRRLKAELNERKRSLIELQSAKSAYEKHLSEQAQNKRPQRLHSELGPNYEAAQQKFAESDRKLFEWFMMLEEHRCDIADSLVQTFKYLLYEFLASSAQGIMKLLPVRMEFRPMLEMTPAQLRPSVLLEIDEARNAAAPHDTTGTHAATGTNKVASDEEADGLLGDTGRRSSTTGTVTGDGCTGTGVMVDTTARLIDKWEKGHVAGAGPKAAQVAVGADPLSVSILTAQGVEESAARRALRLHNNDLQTALDFIVGGGNLAPESAAGSQDLVSVQDGTGVHISGDSAQDNVRMPTTIKWVEKLRMRRLKEKDRRNMAAGRQRRKKFCKSDNNSKSVEQYTTGTDTDQENAEIDTSEFQSAASDHTGAVDEVPKRRKVKSSTKSKNRTLLSDSDDDTGGMHGGTGTSTGGVRGGGTGSGAQCTGTGTGTGTGGMDSCSDGEGDGRTPEIRRSKQRTQQKSRKQKIPVHTRNAGTTTHSTAVGEQDNNSTPIAKYSRSTGGVHSANTGGEDGGSGDSSFADFSIAPPVQPVQPVQLVTTGQIINKDTTDTAATVDQRSAASLLDEDFFFNTGSVTAGIATGTDKSPAVPVSVATSVDLLLDADDTPSHKHPDSATDALIAAAAVSSPSALLDFSATAVPGSTNEQFESQNFSKSRNLIFESPQENKVLYEFSNAAGTCDTGTLGVAESLDGLGGTVVRGGGDRPFAAEGNCGHTYTAGTDIPSSAGRTAGTDIKTTHLPNLLGVLSDPVSFIRTHEATRTEDRTGDSVPVFDTAASAKNFSETPLVDFEFFAPDTLPVLPSQRVSTSLNQQHTAVQQCSAPLDRTPLHNPLDRTAVPLVAANANSSSSGGTSDGSVAVVDGVSALDALGGATTSDSSSDADADMTCDALTSKGTPGAAEMQNFFDLIGFDIMPNPADTNVGEVLTDDKP